MNIILKGKWPTLSICRRICFTQLAIVGKIVFSMCSISSSFNLIYFFLILKCGRCTSIPDAFNSTNLFEASQIKFLILSMSLLRKRICNVDFKHWIRSGRCFARRNIVNDECVGIFHDGDGMSKVHTLSDNMKELCFTKASFAIVDKENAYYNCT